jgi:predicted RecA/RadA family phage recombinase
MKNYVQPGNVLTMIAPSGGIVGGNFYKIGSIFGVAAFSAAQGEAFELKCGEVYDLPKTAAEAWAPGDIIYATSGNVMTTIAAGNTKVGVAILAAANPSGVGRVRLNNNF